MIDDLLLALFIYIPVYVYPQVQGVGTIRFVKNTASGITPYRPLALRPITT